MHTGIRSIKDLKVYEKAYQLAMEIFEITKYFPKGETYSLTDQIRRASRSVAINNQRRFCEKEVRTDFHSASERCFGFK